MKRALIVLVLIAGCEKDRPAEKPPAATSSTDVAAADVDLIVGTDHVALGNRSIPDVGGAVDLDTLATVLGDRDGIVVVALGPAATYQRFNDVLDAARRAGLQPQLYLGRDRTLDLTTRATTSAEAEPILVLTLSTDAVHLGQDVVPSVWELRGAIGRRPKIPARLAILADRRTRGDVLVAAVTEAQAAGVGDVFFVTEQMMAPPPSMPVKKPAAGAR